ncbi:MAG: pentapeptide repeat-containing protein [Candidatus Binatales bacterium]
MTHNSVWASVSAAADFLSDHPNSILLCLYFAIIFLGLLLFFLGKTAETKLRGHPFRVGTVAFLLAITLLWWVPRWQAKALEEKYSTSASSALSNTARTNSPINPPVTQNGISPAQLQWAEDQARSSLAQILGGLFLLVGLYFTWWRMEEAETSRTAAREEAEKSRAAAQTQATETARIAQEGLITECFARAIEQLGTDKMGVRLGAIYSLERIAHDSKRDHWPIMEVLTAYVRDRFPLGSIKYDIPDVDLQATVTVLGRRTLSYEVEKQRLDLTRTDLIGVDMRGLHFEKADFTLADFRGARLNGAHLEGATLTGAFLSEAYLSGVHLENAELMHAFLGGADLTEALLQGAHMNAADLEKTVLRDSHLEGADLQGAHGLTQEQISSAHTDEKTTKLPSGLVHGKH